MKANHLRSIAVLTVLAAAFLWFVLSYGQVSAYEDPVVCWDGSHKYLNRGPNTQGGDISGCHQVMKFCKCASQTHEYGYWNGSYYEHANSEGEAFLYLDPDNNTNWLSVQNDTLSKNFRFTRVRCSDGVWYDVNKTYYTREYDSTVTTTTTTTMITTTTVTATTTTTITATTTTTTTTTTTLAGNVVCQDCCVSGEHGCYLYCNGRSVFSFS